jgi:hypothetical protein
MIMKLKKFKLKKIGTVLAVLVFGVVSFTAGVDLTNKGNSATSASVLPMNKGGTGQNSLANVMGVGSANKLATPRKINGIPFDGTSNIETWNTITVPSDHVQADALYLKYQVGDPIKTGGNASTHGSKLEIFTAVAPAATDLSTYKGLYVEFIKKQTSEFVYNLSLESGLRSDSVTFANNDNGSSRNWEDYFKVINIPANRMIKWQSSAADNQLTLVTDPDELALAKSKTYNYMNYSFPPALTPAPTTAP